MNKDRLKYSDVMEFAPTEEVGVIILTDEKGERQLTIACDKALCKHIKLRAAGTHDTSRLLPEVLLALLGNKTEGYELLIDDVNEGQYTCWLCDVNDESVHISIRMSDAVLLSLVGNIPIYIEHGLMMRQGVPSKSAKDGVLMPINTLSTKMLREALAQAVSDERYELASALRDELKRRGALKQNAGE